MCLDWLKYLLLSFQDDKGATISYRSEGDGSDSGKNLVPGWVPSFLGLPSPKLLCLHTLAGMGWLVSLFLELGRYLI